MMTEQEKQQLSLDVAEKYGIDEFLPKIVEVKDDSVGYYAVEEIKVWLHEDSARCFDLMVEHKIEFACTKHIAVARFELTQVIQVPYNPYQSKQEATRIAILRALLAKGE